MHHVFEWKSAYEKNENWRAYLQSNQATECSLTVHRCNWHHEFARAFVGFFGSKACWPKAKLVTLPYLFFEIFSTGVFDYPVIIQFHKLSVCRHVWSIQISFRSLLHGSLLARQKFFPCITEPTRVCIGGYVSSCKEKENITNWYYSGLPERA